VLNRGFCLVVKEIHAVRLNREAQPLAVAVGSTEATIDVAPAATLSRISEPRLLPPRLSECLHSSDGEVTWNDRHGRRVEWPSLAGRRTAAFGSWHAGADIPRYQMAALDLKRKFVVNVGQLTDAAHHPMGLTTS
jgi:hypothetical protein